MFPKIRNQSSCLCSCARSRGDVRGAWLILALTLLISPAAMGSDSAIHTMLAVETVSIDGNAYTFTKYIDNTEGDLKVQIRSSAGKVISADDLPRAPAPELVSHDVRHWLQESLHSSNEESKLTVDIALDLDLASAEILDAGDLRIVDGNLSEARILNDSVGLDALKAHSMSRVEYRNLVNQKIAAQRQDSLMDWLAKHNLDSVRDAEASVSRGGTSLTLSLTADQLWKILDSEDPAVAGIDIYLHGEDDINSAMAATKVSNWALPYSTTRGGGIGIYMTEGGCADPSNFSSYIRLAGSQTDHSVSMGAILRTVSPDSFLYCRGGAVLPQTQDLTGVSGNPPIYIVTRSNTPSSGDTTDYLILDRSWDDFSYDYDISIFNSGGNTGQETGNIRSPGKALNLITVGNYNHNTNSIWSTSPFVNSHIQNQKPEVVAPGRSINAGGITYTGTSPATAHAAGFTANLMSASHHFIYRPYLAKAKLLAGATNQVSGGYNKVGLGGINFETTQWNGIWSWWSGDAQSWDHFDAFDGDMDGAVTYQVYIPLSWDKVRATLSWMTRGTHTYNNRNQPFPIGLDLDMIVFNPSGSMVAWSTSFRDSFESVEFDPVTSGIYTIKIYKASQRDTLADIRMGLHINFFND